MKTIIILALLSFSSCAHTKTQAPVQAPVTPQPAVVQHPAASDANASKVSCTRGTDVRTLEVVKKSAKVKNIVRTLRQKFVASSKRPDLAANS
jgi:hypothetical protein